VDFLFGLGFFVLFAWVCAVFGAAFYHFAWGVGKMKRELAEAREKIAAMENHGTRRMLP
jgi:HAMP domain-containing protein